MPTRRTFIKIGLATGAVGAASLTPWGRLVPEIARAQAPRHARHGHARPLAKASVLDPASLTMFMDPLPLPPVLAPTSVQDGVPFYEVAMTQFTQQLHAQLPPTTLWGYGGSYPGPTVEARVNQPLRFRWTNQIHASRFLIPAAYDASLEGTSMDEPQVKTVVHLHGANVGPDSDGFPDAWFSPGFAQKGADWRTDIYEYPNRQPPGMLWYHDHAMGQTRLNVYAGLAGLYLLRDANETAAHGAATLPHGPYEIPLVIQDRMFDADGSLLYPVRDAATIPDGSDHPGPWIPEFFGDTVLVNGKVWPYLEVEPRRYRFRILNGSNARFYHLHLDSGHDIVQIGADQGFLPRPVKRSSILLAPAERADVIIDFRGMRGNVVLRNDANAPFPDGDPNDAATVGQIMQFRVNRRLAQADTSTLELDTAGQGKAALAQARPAESAQALAQRAQVTRNMAVVEFLDKIGEPIIGLINNRRWMGGTATRIRLGAVEIWNLINTTGDTHPIHLHLVHFQVLGRQAFNAERYRHDWIGSHAPDSGPEPMSPLPYLHGPVLAPEADETGFKDTVRAVPGMVTSIVMRFVDYTGVYPWHCHILDHEDNAMMQRFEVVK